MCNRWTTHLSHLILSSFGICWNVDLTPDRTYKWKCQLYWPNFLSRKPTVIITQLREWCLCTTLPLLHVTDYVIGFAKLQGWGSKFDDPKKSWNWFKFVELHNEVAGLWCWSKGKFCDSIVVLSVWYYRENNIWDTTLNNHVYHLKIISKLLKRASFPYTFLWKFYWS